MFFRLIIIYYMNMVFMLTNGVHANGGNGVHVILRELRYYQG